MNTTQRIRGRIISFDVTVDETVQFGTLQITPRVCLTRPQTEALLAWAYAVRRLGDVPAALELYERATRLQPENAITWRYLGQYQFAVGRRQAAVDSLTRAHELDPNDPLAESWLAIARG